MAVEHGYGKIVTDGLVLCLDVADKNSYPINGLEVEYLIVGGGGGGGTTNITTAIGAGGGGAGGVLLGSTQVSKQSHSVIIGAGGTPTTSTNANNGTNSSAFGKTALGGGGGGNRAAESGGASGGSGGGSAYNQVSTNPGQATQPTSVDGGFGNDGGFGPNGGSTYGSGGGGGGAGSRGRNTTPASNNVSFDEPKEDGGGGDGISSYITGKNTYYGGGGGAGRGLYDSTSVVPAGGIGGGGNGGGNPTSGTGVNGESNTGGGGGGGASSSAFGSNRNGGNGGSGIVVIRYKGKQKATGGDLIYRYKNYTVHVFQNSDNFVVGNTITDITGNQNPATLQNGVGSSTDNLGVLDFDGSNDRIDLGSIFSLQGSVNFTMECFVKINSAGGDDAGIIESFSSSTNRWIWYYDGGSLNQFGYHNGQWNGILSSGINPTIGKWTHLLITRSGNTFKSYIDGVNVQTVTASKNFPSSNNLRVGSNSNQSEYLNGNIAFVKLYNRALTPQEIEQNYNATKTRFGL